MFKTPMFKTILQKSFITFFAATIFSACHAENCPSPAEIKNHVMRNWKIYDIDNGTSISPTRLKKFSESVKQLALAEWLDLAPEGAAHCYYYGENPENDYLGVFLAKPGLIPEKTSGNWVTMRSDDMQCKAGINQCAFVPEK